MYSLFSSSAHCTYYTNFDKLVELELWWRDSSHLPLQGWRKCNVHLKNVCSRVYECSWNMDERVSLIKRLHKAPFFSIMADECTDVTTIEELTFWSLGWVESGVPHLIEILPVKKANAESIYSALVEYCREKNIQLGRLIRMGFDGAATCSGDKTGVQYKEG